MLLFFSPKKTTAEGSEDSAQVMPRGFTKAELLARRLKRKQDRRVLKLMKAGMQITEKKLEKVIA